MVYHYNQTYCLFILEACVQAPPPLKQEGGGGGAAVHPLPSGNKVHKIP